MMRGSCRRCEAVFRLEYSLRRTRTGRRRLDQCPIMA